MSPFRYSAFTVIWIATVVSNVGGAMYNAASGWLMTSLNPDPFIVSMVQVATTLPLFLLLLPAGALADIVDKRVFLIVTEAATTVLCAVYAAMVSLGLATADNLLGFTFLISAAGALTGPAWQAIVPMLVPRETLSAGVTANSVGFNISRVIGPALGGVIIKPLGIGAPFWINAISNLAAIGALVWWRLPPAVGHRLPVEHFMSSIRTGLRYARNSPPLRATLIRSIAFFLFASAYWALLPLVARNQIVGGPELYGLMLATLGAGAIGGAFALPPLRGLGPDRLVALGCIGTALAMVLFALARDAVTGLAASLVAGAAWIVVLSSLNVSAQMSLPDWVRGRGLAMYGTAYFGAFALGSAVWGQVAWAIGLPAALFWAAAGAVVAVPLTWRWKLAGAAGIDLAPSLHWAEPIVTHAVEPDRGPVLVTVEYRIDPARRDAFLDAAQKLGRERRRDGAYSWAVFEDTAEDGRMLETFLVGSWIEHMRQHQRVTNADRLLQDVVQSFQVDGTPPRVRHFIDPPRGDRDSRSST